MARDTIAVHWEAAAPRADHGRCAQQVEEIRSFHKRSGYSDIAYSWVVCDHGQVFVGRGWGSSAATCGTAWNSRADSVCWMGGPGYTPTPAALNAIRGVILQAQARGMWNVIGHRDACSTQCPGDDLYWWVHNGFPAGAPVEPEPPKRRNYNGMIYVDESNGVGWRVGVGYAQPIENMHRYARLSMIHFDAGKLHPLKGIEWMQDHGAWDYNASAPRVPA